MCINNKKTNQEKWKLQLFPYNTDSSSLKKEIFHSIAIGNRENTISFQMQFGRRLYWSWQSYTLYYEENKNLLFSETKPLTNNSSLYK